MDIVQESVTTLHDLDGADPAAPTEETTVVVPLTERDYGSPAAERVFRTLTGGEYEGVVVALRADEDRARAVASWVEDVGSDPDVLWCNAPSVRRRLAEAGIDAPPGKGRDVWLGMGLAAARSQYVVVNDADAKTYGRERISKLVFPLARGHDFAKGYYARVEDRSLYGRLFRLFYAPLLRALRHTRDAPVLEYLDAFRYALAGEFAATSALARRLSLPTGWGLEVATLGEAFEHAGFAGTAQVDLGNHRHEHRPVEGDGGLDDMAEDVARATFRILEDQGVGVDFDALRERYRREATRLIDQYATDAAFNGLAFDRGHERDQVTRYADAVRSQPHRTWLPAWSETSLSAERVAEAAVGALGSRPER